MELSPLPFAYYNEFFLAGHFKGAQAEGTLSGLPCIGGMGCICVELARTVFIHHLWPYIKKIPCKQSRTYTIYIYQILANPIYLCVRVGHDPAETRRVWGSPSLDEPLSRCGRHSSASEGVQFFGRNQPLLPKKSPKIPKSKSFVAKSTDRPIFLTKYLH